MSIKIIEYKGEKFEMTENSIELFHAGSPIISRHFKITKERLADYDFELLTKTRNKIKDINTAIQQLQNKLIDKSIKKHKEVAEQIDVLENKLVKVTDSLSTNPDLVYQLEDEATLITLIITEIASDKKLMIPFLKKVLTGNLNTVIKDYEDGNMEVLRLASEVLNDFFLLTEQNSKRYLELKG